MPCTLNTSRAFFATRRQISQRLKHASRVHVIKTMRSWAAMRVCSLVWAASRAYLAPIATDCRHSLSIELSESSVDYVSITRVWISVARLFRAELQQLVGGLSAVGDKCNDLNGILGSNNKGSKDGMWI